MHYIRQNLLFLAVVFLSTTVFADVSRRPAEVTTATSDEKQKNDLENWPPISAADADSKKYRGVATLNNEGYGCTAFLVCPTGCSEKKSQPAVVMTNGHCTKALDPNGVIRTRAQKMEKIGNRNRVLRNVNHTGIEFKFGDFAGAKDSEIVKAKSAKILYASMKEKDLAVIQLDTNYGDLANKNVPCYDLAPSEIPQDITTVGRPFQGIPESDRFQRQAQCKMEKKVGLIEGDWYWPNSMAMSCPARQGASGSPAFNSKGQVVGILNTGTSTKPGPSSPLCPANSPCEIAGDAKTNFIEGKSYGFETGSLMSCFQKCQWNPSADTCAIAKDAAPEIKVSATSMQTLKADFDLPSGYTNAKYKAIPLGSGSCSDDSGYVEAKVSGSNRIFIEDKKKATEGRYQLCILVGKKQSDGTVSWDAGTKAYAKNIRFDRTPPNVKVEILKTGALIVKTENPIDTADARIQAKKVSNPKDCAKEKDYAAIQGPSWRLPKSGEYLCVSSIDGANNRQLTPLIFDTKGPY